MLRSSPTVCYVANRRFLTGSPPQYRTSQGSTKTMLAHLLRQHLTEDEDLGPAVDPEDARIFLSTKTAARYAPEDIYNEFATTEQEHQRHFDQTRFQLKILRWLVIGQQPCSEAESKALQTPHQDQMSQETLQALVTLRAWWTKGVLGFNSVLETYGCAEEGD
jgi:hypothetical protein